MYAWFVGPPWWLYILPIYRMCAAKMVQKTQNLSIFLPFLTNVKEYNNDNHNYEHYSKISRVTSCTGFPISSEVKVSCNWQKWCLMHPGAWWRPWSRYERSKWGALSLLSPWESWGITPSPENFFKSLEILNAISCDLVHNYLMLQVPIKWKSLLPHNSL